MGSKNPHLYTHGGKKAHLPEFERRYGAEHGKAVYGAVVGEVRRERMAKTGCHSCGAPTHTHYHGNIRCCGRPGCCQANSMKASMGFNMDFGSLLG